MVPAPDPPSLRDNLLRDHEEINLGLDRLLEAFGTGDHGVARDAFREFDTKLSAHLAYEEKVLLPEFTELHPGEAAQLVDEHGVIRAMVDELSVGTDLHVTRLPAIRKLAEVLLAHARREDALFYRWLDAHPSPRPSDRSSTEPSSRLSTDRREEAP